MSAGPLGASLGADADEIPVLNPADCEAWIRETSNRIARGVGVVTQAERQAKAARRTYDVAYALAYANTTAPAHVRRYEAEAATADLREEAENAEVAFRHAERTARALERELMAAMAINSNIRTMYGAAGISG